MSLLETNRLKLPDIALDDIPETTKDFILASAFAGKAPGDLILQQLDIAAAKAGFGGPSLAASPSPDPVPAGPSLTSSPTASEPPSDG